MAPEAFSTDDAPSTLRGDLAAVPRGALLTALLAVTGLLLLIELGYLVGRYVLSLRRTAEVRVSAAGLEVRTRTAMLGKTLLESATVIPRDGLVRVTREIRYPGLPMYTGLVALTIGSYIGVGLFVDGARAGSPSMLGTGLLIALFGLGIDFALSSLIPGARGRSRLLIIPRRGPMLCLAAVEVAAADRILGRLAKPTRPSTRSAPGVERGGGADLSPNESERNGAGDAR
ncbi:MAG TPA: hypothetical protein VK550_27920 [Polyangiaceae bacterium]|nr:hypothetical protein [Polyangiaceae bacterium]